MTPGVEDGMVTLGAEDNVVTTGAGADPEESTGPTGLVSVPGRVSQEERKLPHSHATTCKDSLCLASFTLHSVLRIYPCCSACENVLRFQG